MNFIMSNLPTIILAAIVVILIIGLLASGYVKAPPNKAYIISGLRKNPKVLIGRAGIKIPFLEQKNELCLEQVTIDVKTDDYIPTLDYINVKIDAVVKVKVATEGVLLERAMQNFLDKTKEQIAADLQDSLKGNMKEIIGTMSLRDINNNRAEFGNQVQEKATPDMERLGIEILSFNIQNVEDRNGLIEDMGMDNTAKIKKDAAIAKAEADRDVAIAQAEADQKANEARIAAETEIAKQNNDLEIRKAELKMQADTKKAEADAAYKIQEQEQRKIIGVKETDAAIAKQEREIILKEKEADAQEKALDAEVRKKADADLYDREKKAEAERIEKQKKAEAERYQIEQEALAQQKKAEAIRQLGAAEAEAIRLKATAEAEGMEKKAEAYRKYNNMAMAEQLIKVLPDIAGKIAEPMAQIDKITIIGGGSDNGIAGVTDAVPAVMAKLIESMKETTGVDLADILKAESYDAKVTKNVNFTGIPEGNADVTPVVAGAIADAVADKLSETEKEDDNNADMKQRTRKNK